MKINYNLPINMIKEFSFVSPCQYLIGKYYNCIFDEENGRYDVNKLHQHKIYDACFIYDPGYIHNGLCLSLARKLHCVFGCKEKDISNKMGSK